MTEDLEQLEKEMRQLSVEIAELKMISKRLEGEEKDKVVEEIRTKQYQALFYYTKVGNLSKQMKGKKST